MGSPFVLDVSALPDSTGTPPPGWTSPVGQGSLVINGGEIYSTAGSIIQRDTGDSDGEFEVRIRIANETPGIYLRNGADGWSTGAQIWYSTDGGFVLWNGASHFHPLPFASYIGDVFVVRVRLDGPTVRVRVRKVEESEWALDFTEQAMENGATRFGAFLYLTQGRLQHVAYADDLDGGGEPPTGPTEIAISSTLRASSLVDVDTGAPSAGPVAISIRSTLRASSSVDVDTGAAPVPDPEGTLSRRLGYRRTFIGEVVAPPPVSALTEGRARRYLVLTRTFYGAVKQPIAPVPSNIRLAKYERRSRYIRDE